MVAVLHMNVLNTPRSQSACYIYRRRLGYILLLDPPVLGMHPAPGSTRTLSRTPLTLRRTSASRTRCVCRMFTAGTQFTCLREGVAWLIKCQYGANATGSSERNRAWRSNYVETNALPLRPVASQPINWAGQSPGAPKVLEAPSNFAD